MINKLFENKLVKQIVKFGLVGGLAFIIDYALLFVLTEFLNVYYLISAVISFSVSVIFNYILSVKWVFDVKQKQGPKEVFIFIALSVVGLGINQLCMWLGVDIFNIHYMIVKLGATFIVMVYNFISRKIFVEK